MAENLYVGIVIFMGGYFCTLILHYSIEKIIRLVYNKYEIVNKGVGELLLIL